MDLLPEQEHMTADAPAEVPGVSAHTVCRDTEVIALLRLWEQIARPASIAPTYWQTGSGTQFIASPTRS